MISPSRTQPADVDALNIARVEGVATNQSAAESVSSVTNAAVSRRKWLTRVLVANVLAWIVLIVILRSMFF